MITVKHIKELENIQYKDLEVGDYVISHNCNVAVVVRNDEVAKRVWLKVIDHNEHFSVEKDSYMVNTRFPQFGFTIPLKVLPEKEAFECRLSGEFEDIVKEYKKAIVRTSRILRTQRDIYGK